MNRSRRENYAARLLKKHGAKGNWYKGGSKSADGERTDMKGGKMSKRDREKERTKADKQVETIMFVPATPEGELAKNIQDSDDKMRESTGERRMKVVERGGSPSERSYAGTTPGVV